MLFPEGESQGVWPQQLQALPEGDCPAGSAGQGPICAHANRRRQESVLPGVHASMMHCSSCSGANTSAYACIRQGKRFVAAAVCAQLVRLRSGTLILTSFTQSIVLSSFLRLLLVLLLQLPAVMRPGVTVVVCPLLSLMQDQVGCPDHAHSTNNTALYSMPAQALSGDAHHASKDLPHCFTLLPSASCPQAGAGAFGMIS